MKPGNRVKVARDRDEQKIDYGFLTKEHATLPRFWFVRLDSGEVVTVNECSMEKIDL
jgi:hypothetical protein